MAFMQTIQPWQLVLVSPQRNRQKCGRKRRQKEGKSPKSGHLFPRVIRSCRGALAEEFEVRTAVVINEENILIRLWRIAVLNNEVRLPRNDDSGHAKDTENLPLAGRKSING